MRTSGSTIRRLSAAAVLLAVLALPATSTSATGAADLYFHGPSAYDRILPLTITGRYHPLVGDFDGSGHDDIYWYGVGRDHDALWLGGGTEGATFRSVPATPVNGTYIGVVGDFGGDKADDIFWYGPGDAPDSLWIMGVGHTAPVEVEHFAVGGNYHPLALHDTAGEDAILWHRASGSVDRVWTFVDGSPVGADIARGAAGTTPVAGDFDGNGLADVFWYGPGAIHDSATFRDDPHTSTVHATPQATKPYRAVAAGFGAPEAVFLAPADPAVPAKGYLTGQLLLFHDGAFSASPILTPAGRPVAVRKIGVDPGPGVIFEGSSPEVAWTTFDGTQTWRKTGDTAPSVGAIDITGNFSKAYGDDLVRYVPGPGADRLLTGHADGYDQ